MAASNTISTRAFKLLRPLKGRLNLLLQDLVRTNSVAVLAGGDETAAQHVLHRFFLEQGIRSELYDTAFICESNSPRVRRNKSYAGRQNLSVRLQGSGIGKSLLLNGHIDTVPPGKAEWDRSPWSGAFQQGRVWGLGSFDMKGGIVANAAVVCAIKRAGIRTGGDLLFESVVDEEWGGGGGTIAARLRGDMADACVISEGTQLEIYRATRGGFVVDIVVDAGDSSGYFSTSEVTSPAIPLGRLLGWVSEVAEKRKQIKSSRAYSNFSDPVPVQVLAVESNRLDPEVPLSVPLRATARVYFQFLPEEDVDQVVEELRRSLEAFAASDPFFRRYPAQWIPVLGNPLRGHEVDANHPWLECLTASTNRVLGRSAITTAAPYPCDAGLIHHEFGIPTLVFGPSGAGAHNPNEWVDFESVIDTAGVLLDAALAWTNG
jgi:acetylornithine deacetylase